MLPYLLLIAGFLLLVKGADLLVEGASSIARRFHMSDLMIGLTVVSFGTSTPELFVNLIATLNGNTDLAIGNIVGSNIANILLILGVAAVIYPLNVSSGTVWKEIPFGFLASMVLLIFTNDRFIDQSPDSAVTRSEGLVLLLFFAIFMYYAVSIAQKIEGADALTANVHSVSKSALLFFAGLIGLTLGGKWIVDGAMQIALQFGMSQTLVGLTVVSIGTSLPELATSAIAAHKRNVDIAVGNVVGSNIFNIFFVLGSTALVRPIPFHAQNTFDLAVMIGANILLFASMFTGKKHVVDRWEGGLFLLAYAAYLVISIIRNV